MRTAIIIPVHNRRETTLACLRALRDHAVLDWAEVIVVDDGSSDGTAEGIETEHPSVRLVRGDGNLWWGGAIQRGTAHALGAGVDMVVWLNDDAPPRAGALDHLVRLAAERSAITVAVGVLIETGRPHYGGLRKTLWDLDFVPCAPGAVAACDSFCGNCVCIPRAVFERIGSVDAQSFPHFAGDADFGLRARAAGFDILVIGAAICDCTYGSAKNRQSWLRGSQSIGDIWRGCFHPQNGMLARAGRRFRLRHWGLMGALWLAAKFCQLSVITAARLLLPPAWRGAPRPGLSPAS